MKFRLVEETEQYKGYYITENQYGYTITGNGGYIANADSVEEAREYIDGVLSAPKEYKDDRPSWVVKKDHQSFLHAFPEFTGKVYQIGTLYTCEPKIFSTAEAARNALEARNRKDLFLYEVTYNSGRRGQSAKTIR